MPKSMSVEERYNLLSTKLNERSFRLIVAADCLVAGKGSLSKLAMASGLSRPTLYKGISELQGESADPDEGRIRLPGGGRKKATVIYPDLQAKLDRLIYPSLRGDPESPLLWTTKSTRNLSEVLKADGIEVSHTVVAHTLSDMGFSLQANAKAIEEGSQHPDRDKQFHYLNEQAKEFLAAGQPVISVDTKKKELIGNYLNKGKEWAIEGMPTEVNVHDFVDKSVGRAIPYGVYDIGSNQGFVNVGQDHDTAEFSVESIRRWYKLMGSKRYPEAKKLLITADGGGSNGYRLRLWKRELQALAEETGIAITVCHLPPGTSKWNKIEHRLFSQISQNWRGRPLISIEVIVSLIASTTTKTGLEVMAKADGGAYSEGIRITDAQMAKIKLTPHAFHGEWNYTISPNA